MSQIFLYIIWSAFTVQAIYWLYFFSRIAFYRKPPHMVSTLEHPVSVIICAKNEADNLQKNLPVILNQAAADYEVLVVNDRSTDNTAEVLSHLAMEYPSLKTVETNPDYENLKGKRAALLTGLEAASYDLVLLTDADCCPASDRWLDRMSWYFGEKSVILGYGPYKKKAGLLNAWIRYETYMTGLQYLSMAIAKVPYMGVGRNIGYDRLLALSALPGSNAVISGDDDLLVNEIADGYNTAISLSATTFMWSEAPESWREWIQQKKRHLKSGLYYSRFSKILLGGLMFSQLVWYAGIIVLIVNTLIFTAVVLYLVRLAMLLWISGVSMRRLAVADLILLLPLLDIMMTVYWLLSPVLLLFKNNRWK